MSEFVGTMQSPVMFATVCDTHITASFLAVSAPSVLSIRRHNGTVNMGAVTVPILAAALPLNRNLIHIYINRQRYFAFDDFTVSGQTITFSPVVAPTIEGRTAKIEVFST